MSQPGHPQLLELPQLSGKEYHLAPMITVDLVNNSYLV
jgi:hypothetical protein